MPLTESTNQPKQQHFLQNGEHPTIGIGENEVRNLGGVAIPWIRGVHNEGFFCMLLTNDI